MLLTETRVAYIPNALKKLNVSKKHHFSNFQNLVISKLDIYDLEENNTIICLVVLPGYLVTI